MKNAFLALDIGTSNIYGILVHLTKDKPQILLSLNRVSAGVRKGVIYDISEAASAVGALVSEMESMTGTQIDRVITSINGVHLNCRCAKGMVVVSRADGEISDDDMNRALQTAQAASLPANRVMINTLPRLYSIDGVLGIDNPIGMKGVKLEVECLIVDTFSPDYKNLEKCLDTNDLKIESVLAGPLASSRAILSKKEKENGVLAIDIGGGTTSIAVFEEERPLYMNVLPIGGNHITNDIAIWLKSNIDVAEKIKIEQGSSNPKKLSKKDTVDLSKYAGGEENLFSRKELAEVIEARLEEIFDYVNNDLKQISRYAKLPAGAVLCGATAKLPEIMVLAKERLKLPVRIGNCELEGFAEKDNSSFMKVIGLLLNYLDTQAGDRYIGSDFGNKIKKFFKNFIP